MSETATSPTLRETWTLLSEAERCELFFTLPREKAEECFLSLTSREQADLIQLLPEDTRAPLLRLLAPDDAVDLVQQVPKEERTALLPLFDRLTRKEITALLAYAEDEAGGLMSPRYARARPEMTVDETISYIRRQARRELATMSYAYILDDQQHLLGVISLRELFVAEGNKKIEEIMHRDVFTVAENTNQETVAQLLTERKLVAIPVVDADYHLQGIITIDDVMDVLQEEVTEDIQKMGGAEAIGSPYLESRFTDVVRSRAGWLAVLFVSEMFTASAMSYFEDQIARAVVLALFVPLIISSGGNSGSQAATLVIRAMALGEVRSRHWIRVLFRESMAGLTLGLILGSLGFLRVILWPGAQDLYGEHFHLLAVAVATSVVGVVLWGTLAGALLPLLLSRLRLDPASSSAPFIATLVDVTGIIIYFTMAKAFLTGYIL